MQHIQITLDSNIVDYYRVCKYMRVPKIVFLIVSYRKNDMFEIG